MRCWKHTPLLFLLFAILALGSAGCSSKENKQKLVDLNRKSPLVAYMEGPHLLRKFTNKGPSDAGRVLRSENWWWFIIVGGGSKKDVAAGKVDIADTKVSFWWQLHDGTYALSQLKLGDIRVEIDSSATTPSIEFVLRGTNEDYNEYYPNDSAREYRTADPQGLINTYVHHAVLHVRSEDWLVHIELP